jgi:tetratricopeptide (TPR) repeat protein
MKNLTLLISLLILIISASCSNEKMNQKDEKSQENLKAKVIEKEKTIGEAISNKKVKIEQIRTLLKMYDKLYMANPKDTAMATYLMKGGELALHYNLLKRALNYFDAVEISFEDSRHYPMAVFMKAFVYEEAKDTALARVYYEKFIRENPDHELVDDAETSIENLGKTLEEIVQEFESQRTPEQQNAKIEKKKKKIDGGF